MVLIAIAWSCGGDGHAPGATEPPDGIPPPAWAVLYAADDGDTGSGLAVGDFNDDQQADVVFTAALADGPNNGRADAGEVYVFLGPLRPGQSLDASENDQALIIYGASPGDQLGRAVAAGDVNDDGIADIIIAAPMADARGKEDRGLVHVFFGSRDLGSRRDIDLAEVEADFTVMGADQGDLAGFFLRVADLNNDGSTDLMIGAFAADGPDNKRVDAGEAYVLLGRREWSDMNLGAAPADVTVFGAESGDNLGVSLNIGDINGDGLTDLVAAAPFAGGPDNGRSKAGETYVIFAPLPGQLDIADDEQDVTIYGADPGEQLGHDIAIADFDDDGADDLALTALSSDGLDNATRLAGEVHLIPGSGSLPPTIDVGEEGASTVLYGSRERDRLGRSASVGDVDGDGRADLLLAAPGADGPLGMSPDAGEVYVLLGGNLSDGSSPFVSQVTDLTLVGLDQGDILAHEAAGKPPLLTWDLDGDGRQEILVAAPMGDGPDDLRTDSGEAYLIFGQ